MGTMQSNSAVCLAGALLHPPATLAPHSLLLQPTSQPTNQPKPCARTHQAQLTCRMELLRRWRSPKVKNSMGTRWPWRRPCLFC